MVPWYCKATTLGEEGASGDLMRITESGNVGIGTTVPGAKLDVNASGSTWGGWLEAIRFSNGAHSAITHPGGGLLFGLHGNTNFYWANTTAGTYSMILGNTGNLSIGSKTLIAGSSGSSYFNGGNVGIGTTSPQVRLAVNGPGVNVYATDVWIENNMHVQGNETLLQGGRGRMRVGTTWQYIGLYADPSSTGAVNDLVLGASSGRVRIGPDGSGQILRTDIFQLGNKWRLSGIGDVQANDDWLRFLDINNTVYYGGLAAGRLWTAQGNLAGSDARLKKDVKTLYGALNK